MKPITLPKPPGINALYKITCRNGFPSMYKSAEGKAWIESAGYALKSQWKKKVLLGDISLYITVYYFGRFDIDSCLKPLLDLLQTMSVIGNDSQIDFIQVSKIKAKSKKDQRVELEIDCTS